MATEVEFHENSVPQDCLEASWLNPVPIRHQATKWAGPQLMSPYKQSLLKISFRYQAVPLKLVTAKVRGDMGLCATGV